MPPGRSRSRSTSPRKESKDGEPDYINRCICGFTNNDDHMM